MVRRDGCLKLFQKPLDAKKVLKNRSKGIDITSALTSSRSNQVGDCMRPSLILSFKPETLLSFLPFPGLAYVKVESRCLLSWHVGCPAGRGHGNRDGAGVAERG